MESHIYILEAFSFTEMIEVPSVSQSGGFVLLWNNEVVTVNNFTRNGQAIHAMIEPPPKGWFKANIDGAFKRSLLEGGIGGVVRDYKGKWKTGYYKKIQAISPIKIELQDFRHALQLIIREHILPVEVETDAIEVIRLLSDDYPTYNNLLHECRWLMDEASRQGTITLKHSFRERNMVAHVLAKAALMQRSYNKLCTFVLPPELVLYVYDKDQVGYVYVRHCSRDQCGRMAALGNDSALQGVILGYDGICTNDNVHGQ
ncbi:PREDICTED: uncharacterized protein LOC109213647 [Nicotiana attenuata]|uniref:uncharacterized protein LOC109213647 n=1 Tax=Nicotiana attenuata TaxID=49451 RepID=UPI00090508E7|nr:PREDICTED: uncharacterized protein LOC109213647 [Nicotiana attenuata]